MTHEAIWFVCTSMTVGDLGNTAPDHFLADDHEELAPPPEPAAATPAARDVAVGADVVAAAVTAAPPGTAFIGGSSSDDDERVAAPPPPTAVVSMDGLIGSAAAVKSGEFPAIGHHRCMAASADVASKNATNSAGT